MAINKILRNHSNIDIEPFFEWDTEEGERNLKALPYVIAWFDRAKDAGKDDVNCNIQERKLSAMFQFAKAMPLLFGGVATIKRDYIK